MNNCPIKQCLLSVLAVFAFMMCYETFAHGVLLDSLYKATSTSWRPPAQMDELNVWYLVHTFVLAALICCLYSRFSDKNGGMMCSSTGADGKPCPFKRSIVYGIKIGLIMGVINSRLYAWMPIHMNVTMAWFFASLAEGAGIGLVLGLVCKSKGECAPK